jgi:hypothetical protein
LNNPFSKVLKADGHNQKYKLASMPRNTDVDLNAAIYVSILKPASNHYEDIQLQSLCLVSIRRTTVLK